MYNIKARKQKFETRARIQVERKGSRWRKVRYRIIERKVGIEQQRGGGEDEDAAIR